MDTDEKIDLRPTTFSRSFTPSENPLLRNKGAGSPFAKPITQKMTLDYSVGIPTVRLGSSFLLSADPYKKSR